MIEYAGALENLYTRAGMTEKAREEQDTIDVIDRLATAKGESTNRNLAIILADHRRHLDHAFELVQAEIRTRPDVYTWDALACILFQTGHIEDAKSASAKALRFETPEPAFHEHAAIIAGARTE